MTPNHQKLTQNEPHLGHKKRQTAVTTVLVAEQKTAAESESISNNIFTKRHYPLALTGEFPVAEEKRAGGNSPCCTIG